MRVKEKHASLSEMTDQEIEKRYEGNDDLISIKKFEKVRLLITEGYKELEKFKGEDISVFVGNTRSGKSTIINTILDNRLVASMKGKKAKISLSDDADGPEIGNESVSETKIPSRYESKDFGIIWDCPGYGDNRGDTQDIVNNFYIKKLIENARSVKIFVVSDFNDINTDGVAGLISLTKSIDLSFGENSETDGKSCVLRDLIDCGAIGLVITKSEEEEAEEIKELYRDEFLNVSGMSKTGTADELVRHFLDDAMCITPRITKDHLDENYVVDKTYLKSPIACLFSSLKAFGIDEGFSVRPGLSPSAQKFIYSYYTDEGMLREFKNFFGFIENKSSSYLSVLSLDDKDLLDKLLTNIVNKMEYIDKFRQDIDSFNSLKDLVISVKDSLPCILDPMNEDVNQEYVDYVEKYFEDKEMVPQAVFLDFLAGSILKVNSSLRPVVEKFLSDLKSNYSRNVNDIYLQLGRIKEDEHLRKQEEILAERKLMEDNYRSELKQREEDRRKQQEDFIRQQKEDVIKHREEQDRIRSEMAKQNQEEKEKYAKDMDRRDKEWKKIQENLAADYAQKLKDMDDKRVSEMKDMQKSYTKNLDKMGDKLEKIQENYLSQMTKKDNEHKQEMEKLKFNLGENEKKIRDEMNQRIDEKDKDYQSKIEDLNQKMDQKEKDYTQAMNNFATQVAGFNANLANANATAAQVSSELHNVKAKFAKDSKAKDRKIKILRSQLKYVYKFDYDNPLLNDSERMKEIKKEFGNSILDKFIDLCSNLTREEYNQISSSHDVRDLLGLSGHEVDNVRDLAESPGDASDLMGISHIS